MNKWLPWWAALLLCVVIASAIEVTTYDKLSFLYLTNTNSTDGEHDTLSEEDPNNDIIADGKVPAELVSAFSKAVKKDSPKQTKKAEKPSGSDSETINAIVDDISKKSVSTERKRTTTHIVGMLKNHITQKDAKDQDTGKLLKKMVKKAAKQSNDNSITRLVSALQKLQKGDSKNSSELVGRLKEALKHLRGKVENLQRKMAKKHSHSKMNKKVKRALKHMTSRLHKLKKASKKKKKRSSVDQRLKKLSRMITELKKKKPASEPKIVVAPIPVGTVDGKLSALSHKISMLSGDDQKLDQKEIDLISLAKLIRGESGQSKDKNALTARILHIIEKTNSTAILERAKKAMRRIPDMSKPRKIKFIKKRLVALLKKFEKKIKKTQGKERVKLHGLAKKLKSKPLPEAIKIFEKHVSEKHSKKASKKDKMDFSTLSGEVDRMEKLFLEHKTPSSYSEANAKLMHQYLHPEPEAKPMHHVDEMLHAMAKEFNMEHMLTPEMKVAENPEPFFERMRKKEVSPEE